MTELSPRAHAACEALRAEGASDAERERVRARLSASGVAMGVGAGAALSAGAASAAASTASAALSATAPASLPAAPMLTGASGGALGSGSLLGKGALLVSASKLASVPMAVKAGLAVVAVTSLLSAPELFVPSRPTERANTPRARSEVVAPAQTKARTGRDLASHAGGAARFDTPPTPREQALAAPTREPAQGALHARPRALPLPVRKHAQDSARTAVPAQESTLAAESRLLQGALSALRSRHFERALELLLRHEETFGAHALLARERERMRQELSHLLR
jgi:hypothetical protein